LGETDTTSDEALRQKWEPPTDSLHPRNWDLLFDSPKKILDFDLVNGLPDVDISGYCGLFALIRSRGRPLGCVVTDARQTFLSSMDLHAIVSSQLGSTAVAMAWGAAIPESMELPPISIVVCTQNRTKQLSECLQALLGLDYPQFEILVVDNAPADEQTAKLTAELPVRYVKEERPGLDWARNRGITEAQYPIIAFTDDDAIPDRNWLRAIARAFQDARVMAVTGSVLPVRLDTQAQNLFEFSYGGMNHGFTRRMIRRNSISPTEMLWASAFGVGANMAFRKQVFERIKGFDVALDVGTPSAGGGDVEMFHRLVAGGNTLVYEPSALIWHNHRQEMTDLEQLVRNNGRSFGCYLLTCVRNRTVGAGTILHFALQDWLWRWMIKRLFRPGPPGFRKRLVWMELFSALGSPFAYLRSQAYARRNLGAMPPLKTQSLRR
jgi:glycosyltransferase involved in cell wall biosynthesis